MKSTLISIIYIFSAGILIGSFLFMKTRHQNEILKQEKLGVSTKEFELWKEVETAFINGDLRQGIITAIDGTDEAWYAIPDFGIKIRLNKYFANDLLYGTSSTIAGMSISFANMRILKIDKRCGKGSMGAIEYVKGTIEQADLVIKGYYSSRKRDNSVIEFHDFIIVDENQPQSVSVCWSDVNEDKIRALPWYPGAGYISIRDAFHTIQLLSAGETL